MDRRVGIVALAIATAVNAACSLLVDTDGLGGTPASTDGDAAPSSTGTDAGSIDAPVGDGASPADATTDAPAADAGSPCVGAAWFCDDFEGLFGAKWSSNEASGGAALRVGDAKTGAFAMQAQVEAMPGGRYANLIRTLDAVPSRVACDFDLKLTAVPTAGEIDVFVLKRVAGDKTHGVYLASFDGTWGIYELLETNMGASVDRGATTALAPPQGQWMHLRLETDFDALSLAVNGAPIATLSGLTPLAGATTSHLALGLPYVSGSQSASLLVDNLACALGP